jgi:hypothetical protein
MSGSKASALLLEPIWPNSGTSCKYRRIRRIRRTSAAIRPVHLRGSGGPDTLSAASSTAKRGHRCAALSSPPRPPFPSLVASFAEAEPQTGIDRHRPRSQYGPAGDTCSCSYTLIASFSNTQALPPFHNPLHGKPTFIFETHTATGPGNNLANILTPFGCSHHPRSFIARSSLLWHSALRLHPKGRASIAIADIVPIRPPATPHSPLLQRSNRAREKQQSTHRTTVRTSLTIVASCNQNSRRGRCIVEANNSKPLLFSSSEIQQHNHTLSIPSLAIITTHFNPHRRLLRRRRTTSV